MSWNYAELDQRQEIAALKQQLSVQAAQCAQYEGDALKYQKELKESNQILREVTDKLRHEESQVIQLESSLKKRTEEYNREKFDRENKENALQNMAKEVKRQATAYKEAQLAIESLSYDKNGSLAEHTKAIQEKLKLENQVRELQGELRVKLQTPPQSAKITRRPRSSSLTNFKVANLESDLEKETCASSELKSELERSKEKLGKLQRDLVRVENEKGALEKQLFDKDRMLKDASDEIVLKDEEISFLRRESGNVDREAELIERIEEEEVRCRLLEQQLAQSSRASVSRRVFDELQERLIDATTEKEMALTDLHDVTFSLRQLDEELKGANLKLKEAEKESWALRDQVYALQCKPSTQVEDGTVDQLNATIIRLRSERDNAVRSLEFMQMESRFTINALEDKVSPTAKPDMITRGCSTIIETKRVDLVACGLAIALQNMHSQNDELVARVDHLHHLSVRQAQEMSESNIAQEALKASALKEAETTELLRSEVAEKAQMIIAVHDESARLSSLVSELRGNLEQLDTEHARLQGDISSKESDISGLRTCVSSITEELQRKQAECDCHERQIRSLEETLKSVQRELEDTEARLNRLHASQISPKNSDDMHRTLKEEIKVLESRVLRRTEQIGIHQHDIKRLETNMRLAEERLGELSSELEMASTEKEAMIEDCAIAREERDEARRHAGRLESSNDDLSKQLSSRETEVFDLQSSIANLRNKVSEVEDASVTELATLVSIIADRQCALDQLSFQLTRLESQKQEATRKQEETESQLRTLEVASSNDIMRLSKECQAREFELVSLRESVAEKEEDLRVIERECAELREANDKLHSELQTSSMTGDRLREVEVERESLRDQISLLQLEIKDGEETNESLEKMRSEMENARQDASKLSQESEELKKQLEQQRTEHDKIAISLQRRCDEAKHQLECAEKQVNELRTSCDNEISSNQEAAARNVSELQDRNATLLTELDELRKVLQEEKVANSEAQRELSDKLQLLSQDQDHYSKSEAQLRDHLQSCQAEIDKKSTDLEKVSEEKAKLQSELDNLNGEAQRAISRSDSLQKQVIQSECTLASAQSEMDRLREQLSRSEKAGKTAEMNLLLADAEHKRATSVLHQRLSALENSETQLAEFRRINDELREQVSEMEIVLRGKCTEIEENDDKFIELLKEKKKLSSKIESLTKKVMNLQSKLEKATRTPSPPSVAPTPQTLAQTSASAKAPIQPQLQMQTGRQPLLPLPADALSTSRIRTGLPQESNKTLPLPPTDRVFGQSHDYERVFKENRPQASREPAKITNPMENCVEPPPPSAGKKRRAPDDDDVPSLPPAAVVAGTNSIEASGASFFEPMANTQAETPRLKRHLHALKSGFTPTRLHGLRPTLSQPSPIRKVAAAAPTTARNSPRRVTSAQSKPRVGWLNKIHGKTGNAMNLGRTSRQASTEDLFASDHFS